MSEFGNIVQVIGPVVDIRFRPDHLPAIRISFFNECLYFYMIYNDTLFPFYSISVVSLINYIILLLLSILKINTICKNNTTYMFLQNTLGLI